jgi:hypothetical protein
MQNSGARLEIHLHSAVHQIARGQEKEEGENNCGEDQEESK